jgi:hypothetical protein
VENIVVKRVVGPSCCLGKTFGPRGGAGPQASFYQNVLLVHGVEQAFRPAVKLRGKPALAAAVLDQAGKKDLPSYKDILPGFLPEIF